MTEHVVAVAVPAQLRRAPSEAADLLAAAEADADALADRLHDGVLQALIVARYAADAVVRGSDPVLARDAVQDALVALRRAVWLLRPRGADDLQAALRDLCLRWTDAGAVVRLDVDAAVAEQLAPLARSVTYRFVQGVLGDGPAGGSVRLARDGSWAALTVTGGTLADATGWTARAAAVGGRLDSAGDPACLLLPLNLTPLDSDPEGDR